AKLPAERTRIVPPHNGQPWRIVQVDAEPIVSARNSPLRCRMETRVLGRYLVVGGLGGACGCVLWWFTFYSSVIANTGGSPGDVGRAFECLFHSPMPCEIVKGLSRIAGYWPYEPF